MPLGLALLTCLDNHRFSYHIPLYKHFVFFLSCSRIGMVGTGSPVRDHGAVAGKPFRAITQFLTVRISEDLRIFAGISASYV